MQVERHRRTDDVLSAADRRAALMRVRLLDAAQAIVARHGPAAMTTTTLAARARTSVGTVYHYFEHRQDVIDALAERNSVALAQALAQTFEAPAASADAVADGVIAAFERCIARDATFATIGVGSRASSPRPTLSWGAIAAEPAQAIERVCGLPRPCALEVAAMLLAMVDAMLAAAHLPRHPDDEPPPSIAVRSAARHALGALASTSSNAHPGGRGTPRDVRARASRSARS